MKNIAVHLADGFEEIEAITIIDILRRAGLNVTTVAVMENKTVTGAHQIPLVADKLFKDVDYTQMDMIILPGGMPGAKNLNEHEGLKQQILSFNKQGKYLAAICAAPLVFGHLGLLKDKTAVCFPGFEKDLLGATVEKTPFAVDGNLITGRGVGVALPFALKIVELFAGSEKADQLANTVLVENRF